MQIRNGLLIAALSMAVAGVAAAGPDDFITDAAQGNLAEVKLGKLAEQKAGSEGVRTFGRTLAKDHADANKKIAALAKAKGVTLPSAPKSEAQAAYDKLSKLSGDAFDKEFVKDMVDDHEKDVAEYEKHAAMKDDPQVAKLAADILPTLRSHLQTAKALQAR